MIKNDLKLRENVPISELTTMRLGGVARWVAEVKSKEDVRTAYQFAREKKLPVFILGGGSNVIGRDEGFKGLVILDRLRGVEVVLETASEVTLQAAGGEVLDDFIDFCAGRGLSGMEAMSGIPGTIGAAPVQNVGAYGQEIKDVLISAEIYDPSFGKFFKIPASEMQMGYRHTLFNSTEKGRKLFIVSVVVRLKKGRQNWLRPPFYTSLQKYIDDNRITDFSPKSVRKMVKIIRDGKLPDPKVQPSAGSFFKNIVVDTEIEAKTLDSLGIPVWKGGDAKGKWTVPSGWLIENAGLKGKVFHGMKVSDKAALILINESAKKYADLAAARKEISDLVYEKFGLRLEQEPVEI